MYKYCYPTQATGGSGITYAPERHWDLTDSVDIGDGGAGWLVYSIAGGTIVAERHDIPNHVETPGTGNYIAIKITDDCELQGHYVTYMHMLPNENQKTVGTYVSRGSIIGTVGDTGNSSGSHLHIQIRSGWWDKTGNEIDKIDFGDETTYPYRPGYSFESAYKITDQLFRCMQPQWDTPINSGPVDSSEETDIRIACTIAMKEAQSLGMIGMQEIVAVVYNRIKSTAFYGDTPYEIVSAPNQFSPYSQNKELFDSGGYTKEEINSELWIFTEKMLKGEISFNENGDGWASGYNPLISKAYYFRSDKKIEKDYLFTRTKGTYRHYYNGINMWS